MPTEKDLQTLVMLRKAAAAAAGGPDFEECPLQKSNHEVAERTSYPRFPSPPLPSGELRNMK